MYSSYVLLLMVTCLVYTTNCVVYHVVPDDHYLATNNNTLQHYLNNSEKYFTSHTQLVFLPGKHHLHTDLVIENVSNVTLRGINQTAVKDTIIYCNISTQIVISYSTRIEIKYLSIKECGYSQQEDLQITVRILSCSDLFMRDSVFNCQYPQQCGLALVNVVGIVRLHYFKSSYLLISHNMTRRNVRMTIKNYTHIGHSSYKHRAIEVFLYEHSQRIMVNFFYITLIHVDKAINIFCLTSNGTNEINIKGMDLTDITLRDNAIKVILYNGIKMYNNRFGIVIRFINCNFAKINSSSETTSLGLFAITERHFYYSSQYSTFTILQCTFNDIIITAILRTAIKMESLSWKPMREMTVSVRNTTFSKLKITIAVLWL